MGFPPDARRATAARRRLLQRKRALSPQHLSGTAGRARCIGTGTVPVADVGIVEAGLRRDTRWRTPWLPRRAISSPVAAIVGRVLDQCCDGGDELPVRQRAAVQHGRDAGSATAPGGGFAAMLTIAYLANQFPCSVEPYVGEEIEELRRRGVRVLSASVRRAPTEEAEGSRAPEIVLQPLRVMLLLGAFLLCLRRWRRISPLLGRILFRG